MLIYKITNIINGKIYIGQTRLTAEKRFNKHWNEANCETRPNNYFHNALLYYGKENFTIEVIDTANNIEELNEKEIYWIKYYNSTDKEIGYNLQEGGKSGVRGEETRKILSEKKKENWTDPLFAEKAKTGLKKATKKWQEICENNQIEIQCQCCKKSFKVPPYLAETQKYCSLKCANEINVKKATVAAAKATIERTKKRNELIIEKTKEWCLNNKDLILNCPFNKISITLFPLQEIMIKEFNISDWRSIGKAICNSASKKDLLKTLKEFCENIC